MAKIIEKCSIYMLMATKSVCPAEILLPSFRPIQLSKILPMSLFGNSTGTVNTANARLNSVFLMLVLLISASSFHSPTKACVCFHLISPIKRHDYTPSCPSQRRFSVLSLYYQIQSIITFNHFYVWSSGVSSLLYPTYLNPSLDSSYFPPNHCSNLLTGLPILILILQWSLLCTIAAIVIFSPMQSCYLLA